MYGPNVTSRFHGLTLTMLFISALIGVKEEVADVKMAEVKFSARAYCKMMLHAAKYPHCAINGVLLAEEQKSKEDKKGRGLFICDAIPLFHHCLHVTPMAEVALTQVCNFVLLLTYFNYVVYNLLWSKRCSEVDKKLLSVFVVNVKYNGHVL